MRKLFLVLALFALLLCGSRRLSAQEKPAYDHSSAAKGVSPVAATARVAAGATYAVVAGISDYQDPAIPDLRFADRDAEAFANFLRSPAGGSLDGDHLKLLTNEQATGAQLAKTLDWLIEVTKEDDRVIIYFSGHGDIETKRLSQPGYLLGWDAPSRVYSAGGAMNIRDFQDIVSTLSVVKKARVVVITDACHSGKLSGSDINGAQLTGQNLARQFANEVKILSCQPNEYSIEGEQWGGGRGAFSFILVDALYGLADDNNDLYVTLQEVGRYLEDHVTAEVAPVLQVPVIIGNRSERLASVNVHILTDLRSGRTSQMLMLSPVETRGREDEVLAGVDTTIRELYGLFKKALKNKVFLEPATSCADAYYERLISEPRLARLHSTMRRNYAAALQEDAQQAINIWLKADVQQLECIGKSLRLKPIPDLLERAAELLGEGHYMYRPLLARKFLFEGILLSWTNQNPDELHGRQCLALYRKALELEPESPVAWRQMGGVYLQNLHQPDSAIVCAEEARSLAPNWVLPYVDLVYYLGEHGNFDLAKWALQKAEAIDSRHPYVINLWAYWYSRQNDKVSKEKALTLFEQYQESGGVMYPCWHNDYGNVLQELHSYAEAEKERLNNIAIDSTDKTAWYNLGLLYTEINRFSAAETALKISIALDSTFYVAWSQLGVLYHGIGRYPEAELAYNKSIALDSTSARSWSNLGTLYLETGRYPEAELAYNKSTALDPTLALSWSNLGGVYRNTGRNAEAELAYNKALAIDSTLAAAWSNLGALYARTGRYVKAEPALKKAISLDSTTANPRKHLGMVYFKTGRSDEARQCFLKAVKLNPDYAPALLGMAYLLAAEGKTEEALGYLEQAIEKGSTFEQLSADEDLAPLREQKERWDALMKKYFPDQVKD